MSGWFVPVAVLVVLLVCSLVEEIWKHIIKPRREGRR